MTPKAEAQGSRFDLLKWLVVALVVVGVVGNQYYSASPILYRVLALLVIAAVAAFVGLQTARASRSLYWLRKRAPRFVKSYGQLAKKPRRPR
jgi:preprotein translocase subunit SecE